MQTVFLIEVDIKYLGKNNNKLIIESNINAIYILLKNDEYQLV